MTEATINIAKDFASAPGPRYIKQGENSGEKFREQLLAPALHNNDRVIVILDGTEGFGSSFLDEAFGGLVRNHGFSKDALITKLILISNEDESYKTESLEAIRDAKV